MAAQPQGLPCAALQMVLDRHSSFKHGLWAGSFRLKPVCSPVQGCMITIHPHLLSAASRPVYRTNVGCRS